MQGLMISLQQKIIENFYLNSQYLDLKRVKKSVILTIKLHFESHFN